MYVRIKGVKNELQWLRHVWTLSVVGVPKNIQARPCNTHWTFYEVVEYFYIITWYRFNVNYKDNESTQFVDVMCLRTRKK